MAVAGGRTSSAMAWGIPATETRCAGPWKGQQSPKKLYTASRKHCASLAMHSRMAHMALRARSSEATRKRKEPAFAKSFTTWRDRTARLRLRSQPVASSVGALSRLLFACNHQHGATKGMAYADRSLSLVPPSPAATKRSPSASPPTHAAPFSCARCTSTSPTTRTMGTPRLSFDRARC